MSSIENRELLSKTIKNKYENDPLYRDRFLSSIKKREANLSIEEKQRRVDNRLKTIHAEGSTYIQDMSASAKTRYQNKPELKKILSNKAKNRTPEHKKKIKYRR